MPAVANASTRVMLYPIVCVCIFRALPFLRFAHEKVLYYHVFTSLSNFVVWHKGRLNLSETLQLTSSGRRRRLSARTEKLCIVFALYAMNLAKCCVETYNGNCRETSKCCVCVGVQVIRVSCHD